MSKRAADRQITQDILDKEEEPEDVRLRSRCMCGIEVTVSSLVCVQAGQFEKASQSELEGRVYVPCCCGVHVLGRDETLATGSRELAAHSLPQLPLQLTNQISDEVSSLASD